MKRERRWPLDRVEACQAFNPSDPCTSVAQNAFPRQAKAYRTSTGDVVEFAGSVFGDCYRNDILIVRGW